MKLVKSLKFRKLILLVFLIGLFFSCRKEVLPKIYFSDLEVSYYGEQKVRVQYNRNYEGNVVVLSSGIIFTTDPAADFLNYKVEDENFEWGEVNLVYSNTEAEETYYIRPYIVTKKDTILGEIAQVYTGKYYQEGNGVTDLDGNAYPTVILGNQEWMAADLKTRSFCNGDSIPFSLDEVLLNNVNSSYSSSNLTQAQSAPNTGFVYNTYALVDDRNVCPCGWRVAKKEDWIQLIDYLGADNYVGGKLKATGNRYEGNGYWATPNKGGNNLSGMNINPSGYTLELNQYDHFLSWNATLASIEESNGIKELGTLFLRYDRSNIDYYDEIPVSANFYFTVRCIKK